MNNLNDLLNFKFEGLKEDPNWKMDPIKEPIRRLVTDGKITKLSYISESDPDFDAGKMTKGWRKSVTDNIVGYVIAGTDKFVPLVNTH